MGSYDISASLSKALDEMQIRAASVIAAAVPADVSVSLTEGGIRLTGRALSLRAQTDARLRDFAALTRAR